MEKMYMEDFLRLDLSPVEMMLSTRKDFSASRQNVFQCLCEQRLNKKISWRVLSCEDGHIYIY